MKKTPGSLAVMVALALSMLVGCQATSTDETRSESAESAAEAGGGATPAKSATLPAGTTLRVRTMNALSTGTVQAGEPFAATLEEPIVDGTWVIASKGADVRGVIAESDPGGKVKGRARLAVRLTSIETSDGQTLDIVTDTYAAQAKSTKKQDATKVGIASGVGAAVGAIVGGGKGAAVGAGAGAGAGTAGVMMTRGDPAVIASESLLSFKLAEPVSVSGRQ